MFKFFASGFFILFCIPSILYSSDIEMAQKLLSIATKQGEFRYEPRDDKERLVRREEIRQEALTLLKYLNEQNEEEQLAKFNELQLRKILLYIVEQGKEAKELFVHFAQILLKFGEDHEVFQSVKRLLHATVAKKTHYNRSLDITQHEYLFLWDVFELGSFENYEFAGLLQHYGLANDTSDKKELGHSILSQINCPQENKGTYGVYYKLERSLAQGDFEKAELLIDEGASLFGIDSRWIEGFLNAALHSDDSLFETLRKMGAYFDVSNENHVSYLIFLVEANVSEPEWFLMTDDQDTAPFEEECRRLASKLATRLDLLATSEDNKTLLQEIFNHDYAPNFSLIPFCIYAGVDVNHQDILGETVFHAIAELEEAIPAMPFLIAAGGDVNIESQGESPAKRSITCGNVFGLMALLMYGANVDTLDENQSSLLMTAAKCGDLNAAHVLLGYSYDSLLLRGLYFLLNPSTTIFLINSKTNDEKATISFQSPDYSLYCEDNRRRSIFFLMDTTPNEGQKFVDTLEEMRQGEFAKVVLQADIESIGSVARQIVESQSQLNEEIIFRVALASSDLPTVRAKVWFWSHLDKLRDLPTCQHVNLANKFDETPLIEAVFRERLPDEKLDFRLLDFLLDQGAEFSLDSDISTIVIKSGLALGGYITASILHIMKKKNITKLDISAIPTIIDLNFLVGPYYSFLEEIPSNERTKRPDFVKIYCEDFGLKPNQLGQSKYPTVGRVGRSPLHVAALWGHTAMVEELLKYLPSDEIDTPDSFGYSAAFYAARNKHLKVLELLFDNGASPLAMVQNSIQSVFKALPKISMKNFEVYREVMNHLRKINVSIAYKQVVRRAGLEDNDKEAISWVFDYILEHEKEQQVLQNGLVLAVEHADFRAVKSFVEKGVDCNKAGHGFFSQKSLLYPLQAALKLRLKPESKSLGEEIFNYLQNHGADPNVLDPKWMQRLAAIW